MKKVLFIIPSFQVGGTNTSLNNYLPLIDRARFDLYVYAMENVGPNKSIVARYAKIIGDAANADKVTSFTKAKSSIRDMKRFLCKVGIDISPILFKVAALKLSKLHFDVVVGFQEGQATLLASYFSCKKRVAWVRCDYSNMLKESNLDPEHKRYKRIDQIVCVSEYTRKTFVNLLPETHGRCIALHNIIDTDSIIKRSEDTSVVDGRFHFAGIRIVSVGRISPVKRFSAIPRIADDLRQRGLVFKWYIIGGDADMEESCLLQNNIKTFKVEDVVVLLGEQRNPYPYIKNADLLVCTSISEACPNVINEAKILHTPVVATNFGSVVEYVQDKINGFIVPIESIAECIYSFISTYRNNIELKNRIQEFQYNNKELMSILEDKILS